MEIRILQSEEIKSASGLSRYVFDTSLRNRMEYPQTIAFVDEYIAKANLQRLYEAQKLLLWGAFEGTQIVGVAGMQSDGMITLLYVLPQCQGRGYGRRLLREIREYAKNVCKFQKVMVNANPAWTSGFFAKSGFSYVDSRQDTEVPFVSMYALSAMIDGIEKRKVPKAVIFSAVIGSLLFATFVGSLFMILYLF